jgi:DNA-binding transcriptional LysR family regulator
MPLDLNDVGMFVRVVHRSGFAKAARELRVPTSTVSRAIARLEATLGAQLLMRTTRSVTPTAEGHAFFKQVAPAVAALHHAARGIDGADRRPRGKLRVTAPSDLGATFLGEVAVGFTARYPNIELETILTPRTVNLVEEGVDVALRASGRLPDSSLVARKIGDLDHYLYASPSYVQLHGAPSDLAGLASHACVLFRPVEGVANWTLRDERTRAHSLEVKGRIATDDFSFLRAALLAGAGIGLVPHIIVNSDVEEGRLLRVLPTFVSSGSALFFVHAASPVVPAKVTLFRDFVLEAFARKGVVSASH